MGPSRGHGASVVLACVVLAGLTIGIVAGNAFGETSAAATTGTAATHAAATAATTTSAGSSSGTVGQGTETGDRSEIERRLALPPFAYVAETDHDKAKLSKANSRHRRRGHHRLAHGLASCASGRGHPVE